MLESCRNAQERWGGVHSLIDRWLAERHKLVALYSRLVGSTQSEVDDGALQTFCELLVDYVSAGHFGVYEQLIAEASSLKDRRGLELAERIYPRIETLTAAALAFNDHCDSGDYRDSASLDMALCRLGQALTERFELEDCLIDVLHNTHRHRVQSVTAP